MENKQPSLPSNIDSSILAISGDLSAVASAYKTLASTVDAQNKKIEELEKELADLKDITPTTED